MARPKTDDWEFCLNHSTDPKLNERVKIIIDELKRNRVSLADFRSIYGGRQHGSPFVAQTGFPTSGDVRPLTKKHAFEYHALFNVNLEKLLLTEEAEEEFLKGADRKKVKGKTVSIKRLPSNYFLRKDWEKFKHYKPQLENPAIEIIPVSVDSLENKDLSNAYTKLANYIGKANESIKVWEITFKGDNNNPGNQAAYNNAQAIVFDEIINLLETKKEEGVKEFKYTRIFNLSPNNLIDDENKLNILVDEMSFKCLQHVVKCIREYSHYCSFLVSKNVSRFRSHCIVDGKMLLTEDYIKFNDNIIPRIFFLDSLEIPGDFKKLIDSVEDDDKRSKAIEIKYPDLKEAIVKVIGFYKEMERGESLISRVLNIVRSEPELLENVHSFSRHDILNEYGRPDSPQTQKALFELDVAMRNLNGQIFSNILQKRKEFERSIHKRITALEEKLEIFKIH